jgi:hypothetical protein
MPDGFIFIPIADGTQYAGGFNSVFMSIITWMQA